MYTFCQGHFSELEHCFLCARGIGIGPKVRCVMCESARVVMEPEGSETTRNGCSGSQIIRGGLKTGGFSSPVSLGTTPFSIGGTAGIILGTLAAMSNRMPIAVPP